MVIYDLPLWIIRLFTTCRFNRWPLWLLFFFLTKKNQKSSHQIGFFSHLSLHIVQRIACRTNEAKPGLGYCCPAVAPTCPCFSNSNARPCHCTALHRFASFLPKLTCWRNKKQKKLKNRIFWLNSIKARIGLPENRAGSMALRVEGFFWLAVLVTFAAKVKVTA